MHVFLFAKALAKPFMNMAMPEPLQNPDASVSSISIGMLDRIYWRVGASLRVWFAGVTWP